MEETGAEIGEIARAYSVVRAVFNLPSLWSSIEALDNDVPTAAQHAGYQEMRRLIDRATRWLVDVRFPISDVAAEIDRYRRVVTICGPRCPDLMRGAERQALFDDADKLVSLGLPRELALRLAELLSAFLLLDVVEIAETTGHDPQVVAELHYAVSERFSIDETADPRHVAAARRPLVDARALGGTPRRLRGALGDHDGGAVRDRRRPRRRRADRCVGCERNAERVERARSTVRAALDRDVADLATLSVALRVLRGLPS